MAHKDPRFIGLKLLSVFSIGCIGSSMLYLPTFYKNAFHLSTDKIGLLYSITPFVSCFSFPFWTSYLDRTQAYKSIMITNMTIALFSILFIAIVPLLTNDSGMTLILVSLGCFGFSWFGYPVIAAMVDSVTFLILGDYKELYGQQKAGCPIGYGLSVFLTGLAMESFGPYGIFGVFTFFALSFVVTVMLLDFTPRKKAPVLTTDNVILHSPYADSDSNSHTSYGSMDVDTFTNGVAIIDEDDNVNGNRDNHDNHDNHEDNSCKPHQPSSTMWSLLANPDSCLFFLVMILLGCSTAVMQAFLFLFMRDDLHASPAMVGLLGPLGSSTEIICFFFSKQIFSRLGSNMLIVAQWLTVLRCIIYIIAMGLGQQGVWFATMAQFLHGICFSMTWSAAALQADRIAPHHLKNSAQGILNMSFNGVGACLGSLFGGMIYHLYGAKALWFIVIIIQLLSFLLYSSSIFKNTWIFFRSSYTRV